MKNYEKTNKKKKLYLNLYSQLYLSEVYSEQRFFGVH